MTTANLYELTGNSLASATLIGTYQFDSMPRVGELLAYSDGTTTNAGKVIEIIHYQTIDDLSANENIYVRRIADYDNYINQQLY